jgi:polysaccharide export outer membrane protein
MIGRLWTMRGCWVALLGIILSGLPAGCETAPKFGDVPPGAGNMFHVGDQVTVSFISVNGDPNILPPHSEQVREDGTITLSLIGSVTAVGKTAGELQKEIYDRYVPKFFPGLTVTVKGEVTFFYVDGEVRSPGRKEYPGEMTLVKAISDSGGVTDFAKKTKVRLSRGGHSQVINLDKAIQDPSYDVPVYPGDKIYVPRRILW